MLKCFKYRLYPTKQQAASFGQMLPSNNDLAISVAVNCRHLFQTIEDNLAVGYSVSLLDAGTFATSPVGQKEDSI